MHTWRVSTSMLVLLASCGGERTDHRDAAPAAASSSHARAAPVPRSQPTCPATGDGVTVLADRLETGRVGFDLYGAAVSAESLPIVDAVAARLRACPALQVEIQVHTDTVRTSEFNARQSQRVADALRDRLVAAGVVGSRIAPCGYGESRPIAERGTWTEASPNPRVEWHLLPTAASAHRCPSLGTDLTRRPSPVAGRQ